MIYRHRATLTVAGGTNNTTTLRVHDGVGTHLLVRALTTSTTVFDCNLVDDSSLTIYNHGFEEGELNERALDVPMSGTVTINITNASTTDTFAVYLAVVEE